MTRFRTKRWLQNSPPSQSLTAALFRVTLLLTTTCYHHMGMVSSLDCSFRTPLYLSNDVTFHSIIDPIQKIVTVSMTYNGNGWIGIGFTDSPVMVPSCAIVGLPDNNYVGRYTLFDRNISGITPTSQSQIPRNSEIINPSIQQSNQITTLTVSRPLYTQVDYESNIAIGKMSTLIWAVGSSNKFGYHLNKGSVNWIIEQCCDGSSSYPCDQTGYAITSPITPAPQTPFPIDGQPTPQPIMSTTNNPPSYSYPVPMAPVWTGSPITPYPVMAPTTMSPIVTPRPIKATSSPTIHTNKCFETKQELMDVIRDWLSSQGTSDYITQKYGDQMNDWCIDSITDMSELFSNQYDMTGKTIYDSIDRWNVSRVTTFHNMFMNCSQFNGDISTWNTMNVIDMSGMFQNAILFQNQNMDRWNVSKVSNMSSMFANASKFNTDLSSWNTVNVMDMSSMFENAKSFNSMIPILYHSTSPKVTNPLYLNQMFYHAAKFQQNLCSYNSSLLTTKAIVYNMFANTNCPSTNDPTLAVGGYSIATMCYPCSGTLVVNDNKYNAAAKGPNDYSTTTTSTTTSSTFEQSMGYRIFPQYAKKGMMFMGTTTTSILFISWIMMQ